MMYTPLFILFLLRCTNTQLSSPENITRTVNETFVLIPCPYEFSSSPVIWRINGTDYSSYTLPSMYLLTPDGILIKKITNCFDQTSFQCIDTSNDGIVGEGSSIGVLTVVPPGPCEIPLETGSCPSSTSMELKHSETEYGTNNMTLSWQILNSPCNTSQLMSHLQCDADNSDRAYSLSTTDTRATIPSENLQTSSGDPAYFNLTSLNYLMESETVCPSVFGSLRFNVTETEVVPVLLSNDYCSCIELPCDESGRGTLSVAISNPYAGQKDFICNVALSDSDPLTGGVACYNSNRCVEITNFLLCNEYPYFFQICEYPNDSTRCSVCFQNANELNGTRMDFFFFQINICTDQRYYYDRMYFRSFALKTMPAFANISVNESSKEVCFSSISRDCNLTYNTSYNFSVTDITGNVIFRNESIPELTCTKINTYLPPQCSPFNISAQPVNKNIKYNPVSQQIYGTDTRASGEVCSCLNAGVYLLWLRASDVYNSSIYLYYYCSSIYLTPINIIVNVSNGMQYTFPCENGRFLFETGITIMLDDDYGKTINICGYASGSSNVICLLSSSCIALVLRRYPTTTGPNSSPSPTPTPNPRPRILLIGVLVSTCTLLLAGIPILAIIVWCCSRKQRVYHPAAAQSESISDYEDDQL